jgi:tetratricopeptide (TPR) repeat protein
MGGDATFSGTSYQGRIIAFVETHILAQQRLGWLGPVDDTPTAVSGETEGPGDDARVEFGTDGEPIEIQAKHGLTAGAKLDEVIESMRNPKAPGSAAFRVILVVDRNGSSRKLYREFATDLDRLRSGRRDQLRAEAARVLKGFTEAGNDDSVLRRLRVLPVDVDQISDPETQRAFDRLRAVLEDPSQASAAWSVLAADAEIVCAKRLRRTRQDLVQLLNDAKISVRPPVKDQRWHQQLDFTRDLLNTRHPDAALSRLAHLGKELDAASNAAQIDSSVRYRLAQQRAGALLQLNRPEASLDAARRALDIDPEGLHALVTATYAATRHGDFAAAQAFADRVVSAHAQASNAWGAKAQLTAALGAPPLSPPPSVAEAFEYRAVLAHIAADNGDATTALTISQGLLAKGHRPPDILFLRANVILSNVPDDSTGTNRESLLEAERLATELIDALDDESHPLMTKGLVLRASARRLLGRSGEADTDLATAQMLRPDDPDALRHAAQVLFDAGNLSGVLALLRQAVVDTTPELLVIRARVRAMVDDAPGARADLAALGEQFGKAVFPDDLRLSATEVALILDDPEEGRRYLDAISGPVSGDSMYSVLRARLAFLSGNIDDGIALYREATSREGGRRAPYLAELASQLLKEKRKAEAVAVFDEISPEPLPSHARSAFAAALFQTGAFDRAQQLVDTLVVEGPLPPWALALATDIALRREDPDSAVKHLKTLIATGKSTAQAEIALANVLIENGRYTDAEPYLESLTRKADLTPLERMQTAQLFNLIDRTHEALPMALRAFRDASDDPRLHRAFIMMALLSKEEPDVASNVGPDTYVKLRSDDGTTREHTIFSDPPIDPLRHQLFVDEAAAAGLLDATVGTIITRNLGGIEQRWTVEEIKPALVHVVQDAMMHYEDRFPKEPFFLVKMHIGDGTSVRDFAPIVASLETKKAFVNRVFSMYHEQGLPLGIVATLLGGTVADAIEYVTTRQDDGQALLIEWAPPAEQAASRSAAMGATDVVLTRSALVTAAAQGLLPKIAEAYRLIVPRSLYNEIRTEVAEAKHAVEEGQHTLMSGPYGLHLHDIEPGSQSLSDHLTRRKQLLTWLDEFAIIEPRPLATIDIPSSKSEEVRRTIGASSYDAVALAEHYKATLFADDLGLRRFSISGTRASSFSTVSFVEAMVTRGLLSATDRDRILLQLAIRKYGIIHPSVELLDAVLRQVGEIADANVRRVFGLLGAPGMAPVDAARHVMGLLRRQQQAPIQSASVERITSLSLAGMVSQWPAPFVAQLLVATAANEFPLLPQLVNTLVSTCRTFLRELAMHQAGGPSS